MVGKGSIEVCLLGEKGIRVEVNNLKKGSMPEAVASNLISLRRLARALLGFLGDVHSNSCCICWLTQQPTEDAMYPAYFIVYNSNPRLELNTLSYCSSITSFFVCLFGRFIDWMIYSFNKYSWSIYCMLSTLLGSGHRTVSQETATLMRLPF